MKGTETIIYKGRQITRYNGLRWEWCPFINLINKCDKRHLHLPTLFQLIKDCGFPTVLAGVIQPDMFHYLTTL